MLPRTNRLPVKAIHELKRIGKLYKGFFLGVLVAKNNLRESRAAIVVSTKVSKKASERNRIKRIIRSFLISGFVNKVGGYDILILVKSNIVDKGNDQIKQDLGKVFTGANLS